MRCRGISSICELPVVVTASEGRSQNLISMPNAEYAQICSE